MQKDEIKFLFSCGFSLAEIMEMTAGQPIQPVTEPEPAPEPAPAPEPTPAPEPAPEPDPRDAMQQSFDNMMNDFKSMFENQLSLMQKANIRKAVQDDEASVKSPEDLIANIIRPTPRKGN